MARIPSTNNRKKKNASLDGVIELSDDVASESDTSSQLAPNNKDDVPVDVGLDDDTMENVHNIAYVCTEYENESVEKRYVYDLPPWAREVIASCSQKLAKSIAMLTDSNVISNTIGDSDAFAIAASENGGTGTDRNYNMTVLDLRVKKLDLLVAEVERIARVRNPQKGKFRSDARAKFLKMLRRALDLFMSKHDQILTVGNSRFGRTKCDVLVHSGFPTPNRSVLFSMTEESGEEAIDDDGNGEGALNLSIEMSGGDYVRSGNAVNSPRTPRGTRLPPLTPSTDLNSSFQSVDHESSFINSPSRAINEE
jgi:hypothetical protein